MLERRMSIMFLNYTFTLTNTIATSGSRILPQRIGTNALETVVFCFEWNRQTLIACEHHGWKENSHS